MMNTEPIAQITRIQSGSDIQIWTNEIEEYIQKILERSKEASEFHARKGIKCKKLRHMWGLPSIVIPIVITAIENTDYRNVYITSSGLAIATICSAIEHLFNWGKRSSEHFQAKSKYDELITDCEEVLAIDREYRRNPVHIMSQIKMAFDSISTHAPVY